MFFRARRYLERLKVRRLCAAWTLRSGGCTGAAQSQATFRSGFIRIFNCANVPTNFISYFRYNINRNNQVKILHYFKIVRSLTLAVEIILSISGFK